MIQNDAIRQRLYRAAAGLRVDADDALIRFHRVHPRRIAIRRAATALTALLIGVAAVAVAWATLPLSGTRTTPSTTGGSGLRAPMGTIAFMRVTAEGDRAGADALEVANGNTRVLADGPFAVYPVWSPDGGAVAFGTGPDYDHSELTVARTTDPDLQLTDLGVRFRGPISWSPDGTKIAYVRSEEGPNASDAVAVIGADGTNDHIVLRGLSWQSVSWSPDGTRLLLVGNPANPDNIAGPTDWDIYSVRLDGTDMVQLTRSQGWEHLASWAPDGRSILFTRSTETSDDADYPSDVWVMNADGSNAHPLTDWHGFDGWPVWSSDGDWIAFASDRDASQQEQEAFERGDAFSGVSIFLMRPDGTEVRRIVAAGQGETLLPSSWMS
jgi:Tol biopolymer transport system component